MTQPKHRTYTSLETEGEAAVGRIAIWAAWLEYSLADLVSTLLSGTIGAGSIITSDMTASRLIALSRKLLKNEFAKIPPDLQMKTSDALTKASASLKQRNQILHGVVGGSLIPGSAAFHDRKRPGHAFFHNANELDLMGKQLHDSMEEVYDCSWEIDKHLRDNKVLASGTARDPRATVTKDIESAQSSDNAKRITYPTDG